MSEPQVYPVLEGWQNCAYATEDSAQRNEGRHGMGRDGAGRRGGAGRWSGASTPAENVWPTR